MLLPLKAIISKKPRKDGKSLIFYQYCFSSTNRVLLSTAIAIPALYWNAKRQCISKSLPKELGDAETLNREIDRIKKAIEAIIEHGASIGEVNIGAYVKTLYSPTFKIDSLQKTPTVIPLRKKEPDFFAEFDDYIKCQEKKVGEHTHASFRTARGRIFEFECIRKQKITFSSFDYNLYIEMVEFFQYDYQIRRRREVITGLKTASIGKTINILRMFIRDRVRRKRIQPVDMDDFKVLDEESDAIYLSSEEIGKIYNLNLSKDPTLALHRDMFVFGCLTGLRFADYSSLAYSDLRGGLLYKKTNKTDNWVVIPLRNEAVEIFNRHYSNGVPKIANAVFNRYIKEIGRRAGITEQITFAHKKGNKDISVTKAKSEWITSHTCRRSFCTNEYLAGTDISLIMKISGHKTHKQFFKYIRVTPEEAAHKIQKVWEARSNMQAFAIPKSA